jgi:TRAP-type C4-dicarboxylate transport system permease small subunit
MTATAALKRSGLIALDVIEIYIPTISFSVMFIIFIVQVFFRYFLNNPLTWPPEVISLTFIWTTVLGACYAQRKGDHVAFSIVYDRLPPKGQLAFRLIGNSFIAIAFLLALKPALDYVQFMEFKKSTVLKIPFSVIFFPFIVFMVLIIGRMLHAVFLDIRKLFTPSVVLEKDQTSDIVDRTTDLLAPGKEAE